MCSSVCPGKVILQKVKMSAEGFSVLLAYNFFYVFINGGKISTSLFKFSDSGGQKKVAL